MLGLAENTDDWLILANVRDKKESETSLISSTLGANLIKLFWAVIHIFSYQARVFVRLGWKSLLGTNTLAYYEDE